MIDFYRRWVRPDAPDSHFLMVGKAATLFWGLVACIVAVWAVQLGSLIEVVNRFGSFAALHEEGVFFEPECELRAYEALGHEALAAEASTVEGRRARLSSALRGWRSFLSEGGRDGLWAARAEEAIARLEATLAD